MNIVDTNWSFLVDDQYKILEVSLPNVRKLREENVVKDYMMFSLRKTTLLV